MIGRVNGEGGRISLFLLPNGDHFKRIIMKVKAVKMRDKVSDKEEAPCCSNNCTRSRKLHIFPCILCISLFNFFYDFF